MVVEYIVRHAEPFACLPGFRQPASGQFLAFHGLVAGISVGDGYELHRVAQRGQQRRRAAALNVAVVGVGANHDDPYGVGSTLRQGGLETDRDNEGDKH